MNTEFDKIFFVKYVTSCSEVKIHMHALWMGVTSTPT